MTLRQVSKFLLLCGLVAFLANLDPIASSAGTLGESQEGKANTRPGLAEDKGRFRVMLDGQPVGSEEFQILRSDKGWVAKANSEISIPQAGSTKVQAELKLGLDCAPQLYEWSTQGQKKSSATIRFEGGTAKMELRMEGTSPFAQEFIFNTPRIAILDNNLYHQYAVLAALYDWKTGGEQTFPVLIPQDLTPGTITVEALSPRQAEGSRIEVLRVRSADLEIEVQVDESRRLVRLSVPSAKVEVERQ